MWPKTALLSSGYPWPGEGWGGFQKAGGSSSSSWEAPFLSLSCEFGTSYKAMLEGKVTRRKRRMSMCLSALVLD